MKVRYLDENPVELRVRCNLVFHISKEATGKTALRVASGLMVRPLFNEFLR